MMTIVNQHQPSLTSINHPPCSAFGYAPEAPGPHDELRCSAAPNFRRRGPPWPCHPWPRGPAGRRCLATPCDPWGCRWHPWHPWHPGHPWHLWHPGHPWRRSRHHRGRHCRGQASVIDGQQMGNSQHQNSPTTRGACQKHPLTLFFSSFVEVFFRKIGWYVVHTTFKRAAA